MSRQINSKKIEKGDIFYVLPGGEKYILEAINRGASCIYAPFYIKHEKVVVVDDIFEKLLADLKEDYAYLFDKLKIIGVTGTNGKTTTSYLLHQALNMNNIKSSYIGTLGFYIKDKVRTLSNTTPDIISLYELFLESYQKGCEYVVMEVSSHALALGRVLDIPFHQAIFTNLTQDHLDFHLDMQDYALTKATMFTQLIKDGIAIVNIDDNYASLMLQKDNHNITYGTKKIADYQINSCQIKLPKMQFKLNETEYETKLLGNYNAYNLSSLIIALENIGLSPADIYKTVANLSAPPGRTEIINFCENIIIVDYAHTPDAVEKLLKSVKEFAKGKIYSIIGCGGNRDKTKRPQMASLASQMSDEVIFTNDNPRSENEMDIIKDMVTGLAKNNFHIILSRKDAIKYGIDLLDKEDVLLILGKGHENYQIIKNMIIHHDDKEEVIKYIKRKK